MNESGTAVTEVPRQGLLEPVASPDQVIHAYERIRELIAKALTKGRDYDTIPGTKKPTLLKPGAERICSAFGTVLEYEITEREVDHDRDVHWEGMFWEDGKREWKEGNSTGLYRYVVHCRVRRRDDGALLGEGVGACSSMEKKYIKEPRDKENTILKMAKKRALVDATLGTFALSEQFSQDLEDMDRAENGNGHSHSHGRNGTSETFTVDSKIPAGKYKGRTWREVAAHDRGYLTWASENMRALGDDARRQLAEALEGDLRQNGGRES